MSRSQQWRQLSFVYINEKPVPGNFSVPVPSP